MLYYLEGQLRRGPNLTEFLRALSVFVTPTDSDIFPGNEQVLFMYKFKIHNQLTVVIFLSLPLFIPPSLPLPLPSSPQFDLISEVRLDL